MNDQGQRREVLQIKKYPNRRYYDASRSCHVTLHQVHDLILSGKDVCITDSKTSEDITNLVLTQILLEKDQPKLDIFPASIFHTMIRSDRQVLRGYVEQFLGPMVNLAAASRRQMEDYFRSASGGTLGTPMDWANRMMELFGDGRAATPSSAPTPDPEWDAPSDADVSESAIPATPPDHPPNDAQSLKELRAQAAELVRRIEELGPQPSDHNSD